MVIRAKEIAQFLEGNIEGNPDIEITGPSKIEEGVPGTISFLANPKYEHYAYTTEASVLLVSKSFVPSKTIAATLIRVDDVYACVGKLLAHFGNNQTKSSGVSSLAFIDDQATLGQDVTVDSFAVIRSGVQIGDGTRIAEHVVIAEDVQIGKDCIIYPGVKIYANTIIGDRCIVHAGAVLGSDGFGYSRSEDQVFTKIQHVGGVILEEDVEIGANTVIDRATMGNTVIRKGCKLDNLIQIAHNVELGEHTAMAAQSGIAGSTKIGERVMVGGQAGIMGHRKIANDVQIQAKSGVISNVSKEGKRLYGYPAIEYQEYLKSFAHFKKLPELVDRIALLEDKLRAYEEKEAPF